MKIHRSQISSYYLEKVYCNVSGTHFYFSFCVSYQNSYSKMCCSGLGVGGHVTDLTDVKEH